MFTDYEEVARWLADKPNLAELNISLGLLKKLPPLPASVKKLKLERLRHLRSIPKLPAELEELTVTNCDKVTRLPKLPRSLKKLKLHRNNRMKGLSSIPGDMTEIEISCCPCMEDIPAIPASVETFTILDSRALLPAAQRANFYVAWGHGAIYFGVRTHPFAKLVRDQADLARISF